LGGGGGGGGRRSYFLLDLKVSVAVLIRSGGRLEALQTFLLAGELGAVGGFFFGEAG